MEHNKERDRKSASSRTGSLLTCEQRKIKDSAIVGNAFNNFFLKVTEKLNVQKLEIRDAISFLQDSFSGNFLSIQIILITDAEIKRIIRSLKPKTPQIMMR
jgi:hypothetical protein